MSETRDYSRLPMQLQPGGGNCHPYHYSLADTLMDLLEACDDHGRRLDEFWRRCDRIEERLAAIEQDDEPPRLDDAFPIYQAAVSTDPTPGSCNHLVSYVDDVANKVRSYTARHAIDCPHCLRAEIERLKGLSQQHDLEYVAACKERDAAQLERMELRQQLAAKDAEIAEWKSKAHQWRCEWEKHHATIGGLLAQLATYREEAEAMEWIGSLPTDVDVIVWRGPSGQCYCSIRENASSCLEGAGPTPTAAILAAKAASGALTQERSRE